MQRAMKLAAAAVLLASAAVAQTSTTPAPGGSPSGTMAPPGPGTMAPASPGRTAPASPGASGPTGSSNPAVSTGGNAPSSVNASGQATIVPASALERGANSFTEGQAKSRLEGAGLTNVMDLKKDDQGIWRGKAMRNGQSVTIGFDYKGNIAAQ